MFNTNLLMSEIIEIGLQDFLILLSWGENFKNNWLIKTFWKIYLLK